jgi:hypothetical protein
MNDPWGETGDLICVLGCELKACKANTVLYLPIQIWRSPEPAGLDMHGPAAPAATGTQGVITAPCGSVSFVVGRTAKDSRHGGAQPRNTRSKPKPQNASKPGAKGRTALLVLVQCFDKYRPIMGSNSKLSYQPHFVCHIADCSFATNRKASLLVVIHSHT